MDDRFASDSIRDRQYAENLQLNSANPPFAAHTWNQQEQQQQLQSWPPIAATTAPPIHSSSTLLPKFSSTSSSSNVYIPPQRRQSAEVTSSSNQSSANWDTVPGWSSKNLSQFNQNDPRSNLPQRGDWSSSSAISSGWSNNPAISPIHNPAASLRQSIPPVAWQGPDHRPADRELPDIHAWDKERNPALASNTNYSRADWTVPPLRGPAPNFTNSRSDWAGPASNLNPSKGDWSAPPASARGEWSAPATNSRSEWSKLERSDWTAPPSSTPRSEWSSGINHEPSTQRSAWTGPTSNPTIAPRNDWSGTVRSHDPPLPPTNPSRNPNWDSKSEWGAPVKPTALPAGWNSQSRSELSARSEVPKARPQSWMAPSAHSTPAAPSGWNCRPEPVTTGRESSWAYTNQKWKEGSSEVRSSGWGENPTVKKGWNEEPDSPHHPNRGKGWEEAHGGPVISGWDNQEPEPQQHALRKTRSTPYFEGSKNSGSQSQRNAFTTSKRPPLAPVIEAASANTGCFVYGFPVWVRVKELIDVFGEFGSVINVGIKGDPPYAFVDYETTGCIERARQGLRRRLVFDMNAPLEISSHEKSKTTYPTSTSPPPRPERLIPPQRSVPTQQPPQTSSTPITSDTVPIIKVDKQLPDAKTIHLGNLPVEVTKSQIEEVFSKYGSVTKIQLITRPDRAFGFVTFETIASCHKAFKIVRSSRQFYFNMKEQLRVEFSKAEQQQKNENTKSSTSTDRENPVPVNTLIVKTVKKTNDGVVVSSERRLSNPEKPSPIEPEFVKITNRKESGVKNRNIIFVPDVPADTAQQEFLEQFIAFGKIDAYYLVQRVTPAVFVEKSKTTTEYLPTSIGRFAVVSYHSPESAGKAVASNTFGANFPRQRRLFLTNVPSFVDKDGVLSWLGLTVKDFRKFESCPNENESLLDVCSYDLDFHRSDVALKSLFKALGSLDHFSKESPLKIEYAKSIRKEQVPTNTTTVLSTIISKSVFAPLEDDSQEKSPSTPDTSIADASTVGGLSDDDEVTLATEIVEEHVSYNKQKVKICEEDLIEFRNGIESEVVLLEDLKNVGNTHVETDFVALDQLEGDSPKITTEIVTLDDLNDSNNVNSNNVNTEVITLDELNDAPFKINTEIVTLDDLTTPTTAEEVITMDLLEKSCSAVPIETELVSLDDLIVYANEIENEQRA